MIDSKFVKKIEGFIKIEGENLPPYLKIGSDTRKFEGKNTLACLYGDNFDAHHFIKKSIDEGIKIFIVESSRVDTSSFNEATFVVVDDTYLYIQKLASYWSRRWQELGGELIGLTGSSGKTTNKEILKKLLSEAFPGLVHSTKGNFNNHIGVPLTLFELEERHKIAIIEMGSNNPGEIELLCKISYPRSGLITNIGSAHIEFLKNLEGVYLEKTALYRSISEREDGGPFIINKMDPYLRKIAKKKNIISFGPESEFSFERNEANILLESNNKKYHLVNNHLHGDHHFINLAQTFLLAISLYPSKEEFFLKAISSFKILDENRGFWHEKLGKRIFLDAYNANPNSMKASLDGFFEELKLDKGSEKLFIVLGDMNELGDEAEKMHEEIGRYLFSLGVKKAAFIGNYRESYKSGFGNKSSTYKDIEDFKKEWPRYFKDSELFFLKGSRALQLESCLDITI